MQVLALGGAVTALEVLQPWLPGREPHFKADFRALSLLLPTFQMV